MDNTLQRGLKFWTREPSKSKKMAAILSTIQNMNALNYLNTDDVQYSSSHCIYSYKVHKIEP